MDFYSIKNLASEFGTPFYLFSREKFINNVNEFRSAFLDRYPKILVGYSFKTNYIPAIAGATKEAGCLAEVVSGMEYDMAVSVGYSPGEIIFNGPVKKEEDLLFALENGSIVNLDSWYEVEWVVSYKKENPSREVKVGLRINIALNDQRSEVVLQSGLKQGRFGFTCDLLKEVIPFLQKNGIVIYSLHGHTSSSDRAVENYLVISKIMLGVIKEYALDEVEYFNVGGGFFGAAAKGIDVSGKPAYTDYAEGIAEYLLNDDWFVRNRPYLVIEPGASVVSNAFALYTKVYQYKEIGDKNFASVDASVFDVKPSMHSLNMPHELFGENAVAREKCKTDIVGSTCMEKDILLSDVDLPKPQFGDYLCFDGVGAYTHVFTPVFINYISPVLELAGDRVKVIRNRQDMSDVLNSYNIDR